MKKRITFQKEGNKRDGQKEAKLSVKTGGNLNVKPKLQTMFVLLSL